MADQEKAPLRGWIFLGLWAFLILFGIVEKRVYGHPDLMVFFHLPAAVFLVMAWHALSKNFRKRYQESVRARELRSSWREAPRG